MYVCYDTDTTQVKKSYKFYHHAKAAAARMNKGQPGRYDAVHRDFHRDYVLYWENTTNLMSGRTFTQRSDTPYYCSPSSETYWSM